MISKTQIEKLDNESLYRFIILAKKTISDRNKVKYIDVSNDVNDILDTVIGKLQLDLRATCRKRKYIFNRYAFVGVIHEIIIENEIIFRGWSLIGKALKKDHASIIHMNKMHKIEMQVGSEDYLKIYDNMNTIITDYISSKNLTLELDKIA